MHLGINEIAIFGKLGCNLLCIRRICIGTMFYSLRLLGCMCGGRGAQTVMIMA